MVATTSVTVKGPPGPCGDEQPAVEGWGWAVAADGCGGGSCSAGSVGRILPTW